MNAEAKRVMTVTYADGSEQKFEITQQKEEFTLARHIDDMLKQNQLVLEIEDRVIVIPIQNIKRLEVTPAPSKLPGYAIRNARLVS